MWISHDHNSGTLVSDELNTLYTGSPVNMYGREIIT